MSHITQNGKVSNTALSYWKKLLVIIIIECFCLTIYFNFSTKTICIQHITISLGEHQQYNIIIGGFYHFSTIGSRWKGIVAEQVLLMHLSGLLNASVNVYVTGL